MASDSWDELDDIDLAVMLITDEEIEARLRAVLERCGYRCRPPQ